MRNNTERKEKRNSAGLVKRYRKVEETMAAEDKGREGSTLDGAQSSNGVSVRTVFPAVSFRLRSVQTGN